MASKSCFDDFYIDPLRVQAMLSKTQSDYERMSYEEKNNETLYFINDGDYDTGLQNAPFDYDSIFEEIAKRFNKIPLLKHSCHGCGATLELKEDKHIFICPFCGSSYAVGTSMIHSV